MKKGLLVLAVGCVSLLVGCGPREKDVSGEYAGRGIFGRRFETKAVLILAQPEDSKIPELKGDLGTLKIEEVGDKPFDYYGWKVFGVVQKGTTIEIVGALRNTSPTMGGDHFKVRILSGSFQGQEVGALFLKPLGTNDIFDPKYAVELSTAAKR